MAGDNAPGRESTRANGAQGNVFTSNPFMRENYGKIFDHLEPHVAGYRKIFVISEYETSVIQKLHKLFDLVVRPQEMEATYNKLLPGFMESLEGMSPQDREAVLIGLAGFCLDSDKSRARGPAAGSIELGSPEQKSYLGILYIPERAQILPETLSGRTPLNFAKPFVITGQDDKLKDTAAFTISHEVGHLLRNLSINQHTLTAGVKAEREPHLTALPRIVAGEIESDRFGFRMVNEMAAKGIVLDPGITQDLTDSRRVHSFEGMIRLGGIMTAGPKGKEVWDAVQRHSTGFALGIESDSSKEFERLTDLALPVIEVRDGMTKRLFESALMGSAPDQFQLLFSDLMYLQARHERNPDAAPQMPVESQFRMIVSSRPEFAHQVASTLKDHPDMPPEVQQMAQQYLESSQRLDEKMKNAAERTPSPEAAPRPAVQPAILQP